MDYKQMEQTKMASLPIFKHFSEGQIQLNPQQWRKGEHGLFSVLMIIGALVGGYLTWVYVLPVLGMILQLVTVAAVLGILLVARKGIYRVFKNIARGIHKAAIRYDPFGELEVQKAKMIENKSKFNSARGKISSLKDDMKLKSNEQEQTAEKLQGTITALNKKSKELLAAKETITDKESDEYSDLINEIETTISQCERATYLYNQAKDFTVKYGSRGAIMAKLDSKLKRVANRIDIKILDFDTTITMLRNDYEFAENSRIATDVAKSAMLFDKSWELDYAMDVITSTIASDLSITQSNLTDIDTFTANFSIDDEAMFVKLDKLANNISSGEEVVPSAKKYNNPEYKLTGEDKVKSGGFGNLF